MVKNTPLMQETWVRSLGREDPLQKEMAIHSSISCLENSINRGASWATVHRVAKSQTWWSNSGTHTRNSMDRGSWATVRGAAESDMTEQLTDTHNSATNIHTHTHTHTHTHRIPWTKESGRLQFMGSQGVGHDWVTNTHTHTHTHTPTHTPPPSCFHLWVGWEFCLGPERKEKSTFSTSLT